MYHSSLDRGTRNRTQLWSFGDSYSTDELCPYELMCADAQRRRRDLNPRAAINDLLPFQGSPFSHLGTSPAEFIKCIQFIELLLETEKVGFEPTAPFGVTGFQDRLLKPLGHLSKRCLNSIPKIQVLVNNFFLFLHQNILSLDPNRAPPLHR